jgi:hypothetical protein
MATMRLQIPGNDAPRLVYIEGPRITVGRLPSNTVQIPDRSISASHAELIFDDGHYRLHDCDSTNGTFVNGEPVTDYHLREACKVTFGTIECDFDPAGGREGAESLPTHAEMKIVREENASLRETLAAVREGLAASNSARDAATREVAQMVPRHEFETAAAERDGLREAQARSEAEVENLKQKISALQQEQDAIRKAWDTTKAELEKIKSERAAAPAPVAPAVPPAAATPIPPSRPFVPLANPPASKPLPFAPAAGLKTFPPPKPMSPPRASAPFAQPAQPPSGAAPSAKPSTAAPKPGPGFQPQPRPAARPMHPPAPKIGPKGTQKLGVAKTGGA